MKVLKLPVWESSCQYRKWVTICTGSSGSSGKWDRCLWENSAN